MVNEMWARLSGHPVLIGLTILRTIREEGPYDLYDSSKVERELGVRFRPIEETLRDALDWLSRAGMLRATAERERKSPRHDRGGTSRFMGVITGR